MTSNSPSFGPLFSASRLRRLRIVAGKLKPQQCETLHTPLSIFYLSCEEVGLASVAKCEKDVGIHHRSYHGGYQSGAVEQAVLDERRPMTGGQQAAATDAISPNEVG